MNLIWSTGDLDGDGFPDIATLNRKDNSVTVLFASGPFLRKRDLRSLTMTDVLGNRSDDATHTCSAEGRSAHG